MAGIWQVGSRAEQLQRRVVTVAVVLVVTAFALFGTVTHTDSAQQVFWAAVRNSMNTTAITIGTTGSGSGATEKVLAQLDFGQDPRSRILTDLDSGGVSAETETLTTPTADYTRYDHIYKTLHGKPINFMSIIGLWAKTGSYAGEIVPPTFSQTLLEQPLPMPIGNLTSSERTSLFTQIQTDQVYTVDFASAKKVTYDGRTAYIYKVSIQPVLYLDLLKSYAPDLGMSQLSQISPNEYDGEPAVTTTLTIDAKSKQLVKADYGTGQVETYSARGVPISIDTPTNSLTAAQLQERLSKIL